MKSYLVFLCCFSIIGCSKVNSKAYYLKHIDEARNVFEKCKFPSNTENAQNCVNAKDAVEEDEVREMKEEFDKSFDK